MTNLEQILLKAVSELADELRLMKEDLEIQKEGYGENLRSYPRVLKRDRRTRLEKLTTTIQVELDKE